MPDTLNPRESQVYEYVRTSILKNGYSPSIRDISNALGIRSTSTVHTVLDRLERKGWITKVNGRSRTIRIEGLSPGTAGVSETIAVPILGKVTAGTPILAAENLEGTVQYPKTGLPAPAGELFALRVRGESMIEAGILDGDLVIVEQTADVHNGDIVVALIEDEATVKAFYRENGHYRLQPRNRTMLPIIVSQLKILGKVSASVRYYF